MNRRMLQTALVSGAFGVVAIAGFAVAQPATPEQTLVEQEARAEQDPALEVEALVTPGAGDATDDTSSVDVRAEETDRDDVAGDTDSVDDSPDTDSPDDTDSVDVTDSPDDTDSVDVGTVDADDSVDSPDDDSDDVSDEDDSLDSDDS